MGIQKYDNADDANDGDYYNYCITIKLSTVKFTSTNVFIHNHNISKVRSEQGKKTETTTKSQSIPLITFLQTAVLDRNRSKSLS